METLKFLRMALSGVAEFAMEIAQEHPVRMGVGVVSLALMFIGFLGVYFQRVPYIRGGVFQFIYVMLSPTGALIATAILAVFFFADTIVNDVPPEMFSTRFFAEMIIAAILHVASELGLIAWKYASLESRRRRGEIHADQRALDDAMYEDLNEFLFVFLGGFFGMAFSIVCIITGAHTKIASFAFSPFGLRFAFGEWIFKAYCAWATGVILDLMRRLLLLPVQLLYGGPLE